MQVMREMKIVHIQKKKYEVHANQFRFLFYLLFQTIPWVSVMLWFDEICSHTDWQTLCW